MLEEHYMHCVDTTKVPKLDQDCWAISFDTTGMTAPGGPALMANATTTRPISPPVRYDVVLVDSNSGKVIEGTLGG